MMGWPKGLKRTPKTPEDRGTRLPRHGSTITMPAVSPPKEDHQGEGHSFKTVDELMGALSDGFKVGSWYIYSGTPGILVDTAGRVLKWSVIKFEVIKMTDGIVAVRFEDGSFEAIVDPDFTKFKQVQIPKY